MEFVTSDGVKLLYRYFPKPGSSLLLFLHGLGGSSETWIPYQTQLPYPSLSVDLRGHGRSDKGKNLDYSPNRIVQDLLELLSFFPPAIIIGWSLGGIVAQGIDLSGYPLRGLILMATTPAPLDPKIGMTREGFNLLFKATSLSPSLSSIFNERDTVDFRPYLGKIKVPTLILHGSCDELIPVAAGYYLKNSIPHAELIVLPGRTHLFPVFDRKEVIKLLSVFQLIFDRHLRPSSLRYTENR